MPLPGLMSALLFITESASIGCYLLIFVSTLSSLSIGGIKGVLTDRLKRVLAFSSVANTGFILLSAIMSIATLLWFGVQYALSTASLLGILAVTSLGFGVGDLAEISFLPGFGETNLGAILGLAVLLFSAGGIPPILGFFSKAAIFLLCYLRGYFFPLLGACVASVATMVMYQRVVCRFFFFPPSNRTYPQAVT